MNEIFVLFLLMMRNGLSLDQVYYMAKCFIETCLKTMFKDEVKYN